MTVPFRWFFPVCALLFGGVLGRAADAPAAPEATAATTAASPGQAPADNPAPVAPAGPQTSWSSVRVDGPYIAMTFDDGPSAKLTPKLLDLLAERHIHVTFFVVGENAKAHPEILKRAIAEGHEIGNHSWDHPDYAHKSDEIVRSQLTRTNDAIAEAIGKPPTLMRPPYGSLTREQRKWVVSDYGFKIILWSVDPLDWKRPGADAVHRRIVEGTRDGAIILSHDIHPGTIDAMPATLDELLGKGFKFVTVSELLAMQLPPPPPKPAASPRATKTSDLYSRPKAHGPPALADPHAGPTPRIPDKINGSPE